MLAKRTVYLQLYRWWDRTLYLAVSPRLTYGADIKSQDYWVHWMVEDQLQTKLAVFVSIAYCRCSRNIENIAFAKRIHTIKNMRCRTTVYRCQPQKLNSRITEVTNVKIENTIQMSHVMTLWQRTGKCEVYNTTFWKLHLVFNEALTCFCGATVFVTVIPPGLTPRFAATAAAATAVLAAALAAEAAVLIWPGGTSGLAERDVTIVSIGFGSS